MLDLSSAYRWLLAAALAVLLSLPLVGRPGLAHDIPDEIIVRGFVKPEGNRLSFLLRVPLALLEGMALPKRGPGYLDLAGMGDALERSALATARAFVLHEDGAPLIPTGAATRISQPSEGGFASFAEARSHILGPPLPIAADVFWNQGYFDVDLEYAIRSDRSAFALDMIAGAGLGGRVKLFVQFLPPDGEPRAYEVHGGHGWLELDPSWHGASWTFVKLGFGHILEGIDHLLFLLCLVLPFRLGHLWKLVGVVTAFTVGHSITLIAAATGAIPAGNWFPPLIETVIALSIVYMALENIVAAWLGGTAGTLRWRWLISGVFGLVHGFGFSFVLAQDLQYSGGHFLLSLLAFNVGVELGQLAFLFLVLPLLALALHSPTARRAGVVLISALAAHTAWHWMLERMDDLRFVQWPSLDVSWATVAALAALLAAVGWGAVIVAGSWGHRAGRRWAAPR